jgi:hypothetical protein
VRASDFSGDEDNPDDIAGMNPKWRQASSFSLYVRLITPRVNMSGSKEYEPSMALTPVLSL